MKAIVLMFDSLNRHMLPAYGCDWTHAPNFKRLAARTATFEKSYVCSMPCMPARRELLTGRPNLLHRSWGPIEPYDQCAPEMLQKAGVYTHLATDHYHYWEDGGCTYHTRFNTHEFFRGHEGDAWIGQVADPVIPPHVGGRGGSMWRQDWVNRPFMKREEDQPQAKTFAAGMDFIRRNASSDRWMLHLETFDPHEPFFTQEKYKKLYPHKYSGKHFDWPDYREVKETRDEVEHCRFEYAALLSMCDEYLGKLLDLMDELDLWKDTMLIVCTDHGFMLGEHELWAKCWAPFYEEVAHTPFFVWDPRCPSAAGQRRQALVQPALDVPVTLLSYLGVPRGEFMLGKDLSATVASDAPVRDVAIFGMHGGQLNVTDGRYVYMRAPATKGNTPLFNYTLMPTRMRSMFSPEEMQNMELAGPFSFTQGVRLLKIPAGGWSQHNFPTRLYDLQSDPKQERAIQDEKIEQRMIEHMVRLMKECDAPGEQYTRLGLENRPNFG